MNDWHGAERSREILNGWRNSNVPITVKSIPLRSVPESLLRSQSNGAERNAFDSDENIGISPAIQYFPALLRSVPIIHSLTERSGMLLAVMGTLQFLEPFNISPFRSAPLRTRIIATFTVPTERSGMLLTVMGTLEFL